MNRVLMLLSGVLLAVLCTAAVPVTSVHSAPQAPDRLQRIADAITELDVDRARKLLHDADADSPALAYQRARLAVYLGDCDSAAAILSAPGFQKVRAAQSLSRLARGCAGVVAGSVLIRDRKKGIWLRLQDSADKALAPWIIDIAAQARTRIEHDLGVVMPRPLRIILVRDLFSLSAVSGLPVKAAETTGTVAVARWGRVNIISPRATQMGYPWEDTIAHEITHLALSRATRDRAPLWLQEGIAKREETRWRPPRPFDRTPDPDRKARDALLSGHSVGITKLGPSIAMLPTPEAASIAFAEVTSFMAYWVDQNGVPGLHLLLIDLKGIGDGDAGAAMQSVTGESLAVWIKRWQSYLRKLPDVPARRPESRPHLGKTANGKGNDLLRRVRLGDLLFARGHSKAAAGELRPAVSLAPGAAAVRWRAARALFGAGDADSAQKALGSVDDVHSLNGPWFGIDGRIQRLAGHPHKAERAFQLGISADPLSEEAACEGVWAPRGPHAHAKAPLPAGPRRRALCESARRIPRD